MSHRIPQRCPACGRDFVKDSRVPVCVLCEADGNYCPECGHAPLSVFGTLRYCPQPPEGCGQFEQRVAKGLHP